MSDLPEVRSADCGHGFLPIDVPPAAWHQNGIHPREVYLCEDCRSRLHRRVEAKVVEPDRTTVTLKHRAESSHEDFRPPAEAANSEAWELGRQAAHRGKTEEDCPYPDKRTREAKEWLRGFREAKGNG